MRALLAAALLLIASSANALIAVMEGLPTTKDAVFVGTTTPQLILNATSYNGTVPSVSLYTSSNVVIGSNGCVVYSTGVAYCLGVKLSTGDPVGVYVPYTGATTDVNLGAKKLTTTGNIQGGQIGAGTAPSSNFYFDGLSSSGGGFVRIGAGVNQATGYYWGGTRGYSLQERYDLTGTPFTLHDELNNVDRFYLDTSGAWYFPLSTTVSSLTVLSASVGISGATENVNSSMIGNGSLGASLGVSPSSVAVLNASGFVLNQQIDHSSVPFLVSGLINNYQIDNSSIARLNSSGLIPNYQIDPSSVNKVIGISSACPTGSYWDNTNIRDGVQTGGQCLTLPTGGGGSSTMTITAVSDNFLGQVTGSLKTFTLSNTPANGAALSCILDGLLLSQTSDYTYTPPSTIALTTAPAVNSSGFFCNYFVNTSTLPAAAILNSTQTFTAPQTMASTFTVTYLNEQWQNNSPGNNASTGVRCKIFQTTVISSGTAITYTSDATNGDKWTINQDGLYSIHLLAYANANDEMGVSQNNQSCTTGIDSLSNANVLCRNGTAIISGSDLVDCSFIGWLRAGNVLRIHQSGATSIAGSGNFVITRIY